MPRRQTLASGHFFDAHTAILHAMPLPRHQPLPPCQRLWLLGLAAALACAAGQAAPINPRHADEVIERLPPVLRSASASVQDPAQAVAQARQLLDIARRDGDPRPAGRALALLARWQQDPAAPAEVVVTLATLEQYLHRFGPAVQRLKALVRRDPEQAQAWLLLASLHRLQGRLAESDQACTMLQRQKVQPYGDACLAENQSLRGEFDAARQAFSSLLARSRSAGERAWLLTSLAELETRAEQVAAADEAWRGALQAEPSTYTAVGYADFLLDQQRPQQAWDTLASLERSDGVLLRLAIAARRLQRPDAAALQQELLARYAQADLRPESTGHDRERALLALDLLDRPAQALAAARRNVAQQNEAIDLWLLARSAKAAGNAQARAEVQALAGRIGLVDKRIQGLAR